MAETKKLTIDWAGLGMAMDSQSFEISHFLDTETGEVITLPTGDLSYEEMDDEELEELSGWQRDNAELARQVDAGFGDRYLRIEPRSSHEGYREMEEFIRTVRNPRAKDLLERALGGRGAFRRFKDTLAEFPAEQKRWYAYHDDSAQRQAQDWLESQGIEPLNPVEESEELEDVEDENDEDSLLEDVTLLAIYLSSWKEEAAGQELRRAWKGFRFEVLDSLEEKGWIRSGRRAKSLTMTEKGVAAAQELADRVRSVLD